MGISLERLGIYAIAALLPLERIGSFAIAGTNIRPSQLVLLAVLFLILRRLIHEPGSFQWRRPEYFLLLVFLGINLVSLTVAENFSRSLIVLAYTIFTLTLVIILPFRLKQARDFLVVRNVILISAAVVSLFGLWQFMADMIGLPTALTGLRPQYTKAILGFTRIQSTAIEPLYFVNYLLLPIGLTVSWLLGGASLSSRAPSFCHLDRSGEILEDSSTPAKASGRNDKLLCALLVLMLVNVVLAASRGGYIGLIATLVVVAWLYRHKVAAVRRFLALGAGGLIVGFLAIQALGLFNVTTPLSLSGTFLQHVTTVTSGAAFEERYETYERAIRAFESSPWIGIGVGGYGPFSARYAQTEPDVGWAIVNNEPLELLAETGVLGFLAITAFLVYVLYLGLKKRSAESLDAIRIGAWAALIGIIVQYQTFSTLYIMHVWFTIGLLVAAGRIKEKV